MTIAARKITAFAKLVASLADKPSLGTTALLKQWFDSSPEELRVALDGLIDDLLATANGASGADNIGSAVITGVTGATVYAQLVAIKALIDALTAGTGLADGAVTSAKILDGTIVNADINAAAAIDGSKLANLSITSSQIADGTIMNVDISATAAIDASKIGAGLVSNTEFGYLDGVTGPIQQQLTNATLGAIADGSITDVKLDNGATSVKAKANAAAPKASPQFTGLVKSTNNTLDDGAGGSLFQGNTNATTSMVLRNLNAGSSALSIFQIGNDTAANRLVLFSNSSTRTADGGVGNSTIRTDSGSLNLGANGWTNIVLNVDQSTTINGALTINGAGGSFANSKAASGYQKLPGGLIIQWGTISVASGTIVSYPISFPTAIASVTVTCGTASPFAASANTGSLASFVLYHGNGATATLMNWMAIGY